MKKSIFFALIVLFIAIAFVGCKTRCESATDNIDLYPLDSNAVSGAVFKLYEPTGNFDRLVQTKQLSYDSFSHSSYNNGELISYNLDFTHDWVLCFPNSKDTFRISGITIVKKYRPTNTGGSVDDRCWDDVKYTINGVTYQEYRMRIHK